MEQSNRGNFFAALCTRLMVANSLKWTAVGLMNSPTTVNSPTKRDASFRESPRIGMSFVESHTRWPTWYVCAGICLRSASCFIRAADLTRLARDQVRLHRRTNAWADGTPTSSSWLGNKGGWYPKQHSNSDILDAADASLLMAYSAYSSWEPQETLVVRAQTS